MLSWDPGKTLLQSVHSQPELLIQAGWSHAFMLFTSYSDPTVRMSPQKSRLKRCFNAFLFCSSGETLKCSFRLAAATPSVDFCLKVQHVVHSQMLFFGCYSTYHCLSVSLNQSGHSPLTPDISKARYWITVAHWIFCFQSDLCKH